MNDMAVAIRFHDDLEVWKLASSFEAFVDALEMNDDAV